MKCSLCQNPQVQEIFKDPQNGSVFYRCSECSFIFRGPAYFLSESDEVKRYQFHQNDVNSVGYQNFLMPVITEVRQRFSNHQLGLDYGSGASSVVAHLLKQAGYAVAEFDPLFQPNYELLQKQYDFVVCTEVVEHFKDPTREFKTLRGLLQPKGELLIKTGLTDEVSDFAVWPYQRDPTHVGFFNRRSLHKIAELSGLRVKKIDVPLNIVILGHS